MRHGKQCLAKSANCPRFAPTSTTVRGVELAQSALVLSAGRDAMMKQRAPIRWDAEDNGELREPAHRGGPLWPIAREISSAKPDRSAAELEALMEASPSALAR